MATVFSGFPRETFTFLRDLSKNNERAWFQAHKERYEEVVLEPAFAFLRGLAPRMEKISPSIVVSEKRAGGSLMRQHRDVRFSKDKRPYNEHVSMRFVHADATKEAAPGFYLQLAAREVTLGTGIWRPGAEALHAIRQAIAADGSAWKRAKSARGFRARFPDLDGESLKRPPKGFDPEHPLVEDLKRKDFVAFRKLEPSAARAKDFLTEAAASYRSSVAFMGFLCEALGMEF